MVESCAKQNKWRNCYGDQLSNYTKLNKLTEVLKILSQIQEVDSRAKDCHFIAHKISSEEIAKDPGNWLKIFQVVDQDSCLGGFIHGSIEGFRRANSGFQIDEKGIVEICEQINIAAGNKNPDPCIHEIGHLLLVEFYGEIKPATEICNKLSEQNQVYCNDGIFMENITRDSLVEHGIKDHIVFDMQSAQEIEKTCSNFTGVSETACWSQLAHIYAPVSNYAPPATYKLCARASSEYNQEQCYLHSFIFLLTYPKLNNNELRTICDPFLKKENLGKCLYWAVHAMLFNSSKLETRAISFCKNIDKSLSTNCYETLGRQLSNFFTTEEQEILCSSVPSDNKDRCVCPKCERPAVKKTKSIQI